MASWRLERNDALSLDPASFGAARSQPFTPLLGVPLQARAVATRASLHSLRQRGPRRISIIKNLGA
eukprot:6525938-Pyramimonas_sp.AAC.1